MQWRLGVGGGGCAGASAEVALRAATLWVSLALLQRLEAFLGLLFAHQAAAAAAEAARSGACTLTLTWF